MFNETYEYIERSKSGNIELLHQNLRLASSNKGSYDLNCIDQNFNDFKEMIFNDMRQSLGYDREQEIVMISLIVFRQNASHQTEQMQWIFYNG